MKVNNNQGFIRFELERQDVHFLLLQFADKFINNKSAIAALKKYQESLEPEDYSTVLEIFGINQVGIWMDFDDALKLSDDLVAALFPDEIEQPKLKLARVCVYCHEGYISTESKHDCV
jgi:hypothetical protein